MPRLKLIGKMIARGNRTLSDAVHAIHVHGIFLPDAMPVDACAVILHLIVHVHAYRLYAVSRKSI